MFYNIHIHLKTYEKERLQMHSSILHTIIRALVFFGNAHILLARNLNER